MTEQASEFDLTRPDQIEPTHCVASVLKWFPQTKAVFVRHGFAAVRNPLLLRPVARQITIARACGLHGHSVDALIKDLNEVIGDRTVSINERQPVASFEATQTATLMFTPLRRDGKPIAQSPSRRIGCVSCWAGANR